MNKQYEIDDAFLEEVKVVYTPPVKEPEIDNLFVDEAPAPTNFSSKLEPVT